MTTPSARLSRLGLGTAQFGFAYGVTNPRGQVGPDEARRILDFARHAGLRVIDTASTYGESEALLGRFADLTAGLRIVSKSPALGPGSISPEQADTVREALARSRSLVRRERLDGFLVHHGSALLLPGGERVIEILREAKLRGEVERIGCSVYDPQELDAVLGVFTPDIVQLPLNLVDQRFLASGLLARLGRLGVEVHIRSVFLQGVLLVPPEALAAELHRLEPVLRRLRRFLAETGLSPLHACLGFALLQPEIGSVIVGVTERDELAQIVAAVETLPRELPDFSSLAVDDPQIASPSSWPLPAFDPTL